MTKATLQQIIEKAWQQDWKPEKGEVEKWRVIGNESPYLSVFYWHRDHTKFDADYTYEKKYSINDIIFDKDFAKAYFGEEPLFEIDETPSWAHDPLDVDINWYTEKEVEEKGCRIGSLTQSQESWQYHLQKLAISEDRLAYLKQFIEK